jgi:hypothetical protein
MGVQFFLPTRAERGLETVLKAASSTRPLPPFDPALIGFVNDFSKSILFDRAARSFPELIALANFFKAGNVSKLKQEMLVCSRALSVARGIVFHIAPSNVDSIFLYSSLLSMLCGNVNLIRVSRGTGDQMSFLLDKLTQLLAYEHANLADRFFVLTYEHSDAVTSLISSYCHLRVVWGGDETVKKIRSLPLRPTAAELCFPDRFSAAMLNAEKVLACDERALEQLVSLFFNDSIWFAQQACSSPRLVAWIGSSDSCKAGRERFWSAFEAQLKHKSYENSAGMAMDRLITACLVATDPLHRETSALPFPTRILLASEALSGIKHVHCGNGLFYEQIFATVPDFLQTLTDHEQTLSVFGVEAPEMAEYLRLLPMRTLDRVTKIGHALDFGHIWDGYNLLNTFTRQVATHV